MNATYQITSDLLGYDGTATIDQVEDLVSDWEYNGWTLEVTDKDGELRLNAYRESSDEYFPSRYSNWHEINPDWLYLPIGRRVSESEE